MKILKVLVLGLLLSACTATYSDLPLRVTGINQGTNGCQLHLSPPSLPNRQDFWTYYDPKYCEYKLGQEIK